MCAQLEVEMEPDEKNIIKSSLRDIISVMEEEEVVLYWKESNTWKYIRELACDDTDESKEILAYYRSVHHCHSFADLFCFSIAIDRVS